MKTEFGAEIRHQVLIGAEQFTGAGGDRLLVVGVVHRQDPIVVLDEDAVLRRVLQPVLGHAPQKDLGVVLAGVPQIRVEAVKQTAHLTIPAVQQVVRQFRQAVQAWRECGLDLQRKAGLVHIALVIVPWYIGCRTPIRGRHAVAAADSAIISGGKRRTPHHSFCWYRGPESNRHAVAAC